MELEQSVRDKVALVDNILVKLNVPRLLENRDFMIDPMINWSHYVKFDIVKPQAIPLSIYFAQDFLRFDIDKVEEAVEWSNSKIETSSEELLKFLRALFTCTISVRYFGTKLTKIVFSDTKGKELYKIGQVEGIGLSFKKVKKVFAPIYDEVAVK